ncbi:MAG TPA: DUF1761 domain-containing protein [Melioribacteraceae bacterium]|nr:DUF1761 domain-containing protein [Melioribacteraceae bacterium]
MEGAQIHINYLAVFFAALLGFIIGGLWYGPLFGKQWMKEMNFTEESLKKSNMARIFGLSFVLSLVIAFNLAAFLGEKADLMWGLTAGALAGIGWVAASLGITYLFGRKSLKLFLIDAGYQAVTYTLMGGLLGIWK